MEYFIQGQWDLVGRVYDVGRGLPKHRYGSGWEQTFKNHEGVSGIYVRDAEPTMSGWVKPGSCERYQEFEYGCIVQYEGEAAALCD